MTALNTYNPRVKFMMGNIFSKETLLEIDGLIAFFHDRSSSMLECKDAAENAGLLTMPNFIYEGSHIRRGPSATKVVKYITDALDDFASKGCKYIAFHGGLVAGQTYVEGARLCLRTINEWLNEHKDWPGKIIMTDLYNDYYNRFGHMIPWEDNVMRRNSDIVVSSEFEAFMEKDFNGCLNKWFKPETGVDFKYKPLVAFSRKNDNCPSNLFFDKTYLSVGVFYASLIPQVVAKVTGNMDDLYAACKCSGWPAFLCGLAGIAHPGVVLQDAELYPTGEEIDQWIKIAKIELDYFRKYCGDLLGGDIWNQPKGAQLALTKHTQGLVADIYDEIGLQLNLMVESLQSGESPETYLIYEPSLRG